MLICSSLYHFNRKSDTGVSVSFSGCIQDFAVYSPNLRSQSINLDYGSKNRRRVFVMPPVNIKNCGCRSEPCLNGGTCVPRAKDYRCECPIGYTGPRCSITCKYTYIIMYPVLHTDFSSLRVNVRMHAG